MVGRVMPGGVPVQRLPKVGQSVSLVRWIWTPDRWISETIVCVYLSRTERVWVVEHLGDLRELSRKEWLIFE